MTENRSESAVSGEDSEVERSVLAYLDGHPQAADTLQGIVNWWLPRQRYERERRRIEQALGALVLQGKLHRSPLPGGDVLYARLYGPEP
jgi:hypothetical protein